MTPHPTIVLNVVGLSSSLLGAHAPNLERLRGRGETRRLTPVLPAVTTSVQSSMLTGRPVREHGIVGNGWFHRDTDEVRFWLQSNHLVHGAKVWETARERHPGLTCANLFWWFNMYSSAEVSVTPRPIYKADGRKVPDVYTEPPGLRDVLQRDHGRFPLFNFWGPMSNIESSRWIARSAIDVHRGHEPDLMLVYLPHLDYALQKAGPDDASIPGEVAAIDAVVGDLVAYADEAGARVIVLSEYGIERVTGAVAINRVLREAGALRVRVEDGFELLDAGASDAFAVADHQVAHVYLRDEATVSKWAETLRAVDGIDLVLDRTQQAAHDIDHERAGDLVCVAARGRWFSYAYWLDDARAPDFARTVDIHRKPGYDPLELFLDPTIGLPKVKVAWRLAQKKLGFRALLDVIPLDTSLVKGSHGRVEQPEEEKPLLITAPGRVAGAEEMPCTAVRDVILGHLFDA